MEDVVPVTRIERRRFESLALLKLGARGAVGNPLEKDGAGRYLRSDVREWFEFWRAAVAQEYQQ